MRELQQVAEAVSVGRPAVPVQSRATALGTLDSVVEGANTLRNQIVAN